MKQEQQEFLTLRIVPARLTVPEAAWFLGFSPHEIPVLMANGLLKPLGRPPRNGLKFFASAELEERRRDVKWLAKASDAIVVHWQNKNARKSSAQQEPCSAHFQEPVLAAA
jgi:hypothetical protein